MKKFLAILVLGLLLTTPSQADDIRDFQIEGMSIGDSALDNYEKEKINSLNKNYYKNKKFFYVSIYTEESNYEVIGLTFKPKDRKYKIHSIQGTIIFENIDDCKKKKDDIVDELSDMFKNTKKVDAGKRDYAADPSGESKSYAVYFWPKAGGFIEISCYNLTEKLAKEENWIKVTLNVGVSSKEFSDFLLKENYE